LRGLIPANQFLFNTEESGMKNAKINPEKPNLFRKLKERMLKGNTTKRLYN